MPVNCAHFRMATSYRTRPISPLMIGPLLAVLSLGDGSPLVIRKFNSVGTKAWQPLCAVLVLYHHVDGVVETSKHGVGSRIAGDRFRSDNEWLNSRQHFTRRPQFSHVKSEGEILPGYRTHGDHARNTEPSTSSQLSAVRGCLLNLHNLPHGI
jgi:hypothetical protein